VCVAAAGATKCSGVADFSVGGAAATAIGPNGRVSFDVTFTPHAAGASSAQLLVFSDGNTEPALAIALSGEGTDDVLLSGGGCAVGGGGESGLALVLVLLALRRRRAGLLLLLAGTAAADGSFDLEIFRPTTVPGSAFITVERPEVLPDGTLG